MGHSLLFANNVTQATHADASYVALAGGGRSVGSGGLEADRQIVAGVAGDIGIYGTKLQINNIGSSRSIQSRKNGVNANILISPTNTTAGEYSSAGIDHLVAGDKHAFLLSTTAAFIITYIASSFVADTDHATIWQLGAQLARTSATTWYYPLSGGGIGISGSVYTTESDAQNALKQAGTAQYFYAYLSANAGTTFTGRFRKNTANGNLVVSFGSGATGLVTDTTHTDVCAAGDLACYSLTDGAATSVTFNNMGCTFVNTVNTLSDLFYGNNNVGNLLSTTKQFFAPVGAAGSQTIYTTTEANAKFRHPFSVEVTNLRATIATNATTGTSTFISRKNGVDATLTFTVGAAATGRFEDTTHTDSLVPTDDYCVSLVAGSAAAFGMTTGGCTEKSVPPVPVFDRLYRARRGG